MRDDLIFRFLDFNQLAKLGGLAGLALANDLGLGFEHAHDLVTVFRMGSQHPSLRLLYNLLHSLGHWRQMVSESGDALALLTPELLHLMENDVDLMDDRARAA